MPHVPSPHRLHHTTPKSMCEKSSFWITSMVILKTNFICLETKSFLDDTSQWSFYIQNPCSFLWVVNFWYLTASSAIPDTFMAFHRWGLCLTIIDGFFTRGGIYPFLLRLDTYFLFHETVRLYWTLSHLPSPPNQTLNPMSIYQPCTHTHEM